MQAKVPGARAGRVLVLSSGRDRHTATVTPGLLGGVEGGIHFAKYFVG
jgi:hypothetical protein